MAEKKEERVAGKTMTDNLIRTGLKSGFLKFFDYGLDTRIGTLFLESIPDFIKGTSATWEYGATLVVGMMPINWFPNPTWAHFAEEFFVEIARHTDKKIQSLKTGESLTSDDVTDAVNKAGAKVLAQSYGLDACGLGHKTSCPMCTQGQVKLTPVTLGDMLRLKTLIAPCCFDNVQSELTASGPDGAAPKKQAPKAKLRSAAEVFAQADADDVKEVYMWLNELKEPRKGEVQTFLFKHLDSVDELHAIADCLRNHGENIDFVLTLIQNGNSLHQWNRAMEYVIGCWKALGEKNAEFGQQFDPFLADMKTRHATGRSTWQVLTGEPATSPPAPKPKLTLGRAARGTCKWICETAELLTQVF